MPPKPKKGKLPPRPKKGKLPPKPKVFTPWDDSFPTESFRTSRGVERWIRDDSHIIDRDAITPPEIGRRLRVALSELDEHKLSEEWRPYGEDAFLNSDLKKAIQGTALKNGVLIVPLSSVVDRIKDTYDDFDSMCGKTFIGDIAAGNAVLSRDGFYYLTKQFDKFGESGREKIAEEASHHTTWVALSVEHLPEIKMVGFVDTLSYSREPFLNAFDIALNNRNADVATPSTWSLVREWDSGYVAKTAQRNSLYVNYLCARRKVDEGDGALTFRGIGKILLVWAFACDLGKYRGAVLEPVMGNYARESGAPWLGAPNMIVASLYHETFKFQRTFVIDDRMVEQHERWIDEGSRQIRGRRAQATIKRYYKALFENNQRVFLPAQPPPFRRLWHEGARPYVETRLATDTTDEDLGENEHLVALSIMFRPYPTEHDLQTILARIIGA